MYDPTPDAATLVRPAFLHILRLVGRGLTGWNQTQWQGASDAERVRVRRRDGGCRRLSASRCAGR